MPKIIYKDGIAQQKDELTENSWIEETNEWSNQVYLIDEQDYVHGGKDGYDNIPHQQLANRTTFLKVVCETIRNDLTAFQNAVSKQDGKNDAHFKEVEKTENKLRQDLDDLTNKFNNFSDDEKKLIDGLRADVNQLISDMKTHTHKYAGSDVAGGDANTVKVIKDNVAKILLTGVTSANPNALKRNDGAFLQNNEITATKFHGDLDGAAATANKLTSKAMISFYGDVIASYLFDGSEKNMQIKTSLNTSGVAKGTYGNNTKHQLAMNEVFKVPQFTVNDKGILTYAKDIELQLPDEAVSGTTNATQKGGKLFLIGGQKQQAKEYTYTNSKAYQIDGVLYSNDKEVVNVSDTQSLKNKTYEGYTLNKACARDVDESIQGVNGSKALVTSNALFNHQHKYAGSDSYGGHANTIHVTKNNLARRYLAITQGVAGKLEYNDKAYIQDNDLCVPVIHATEMMHIPGGRLWIDTAVEAMDGATFNPDTLAKIANLEEKVKNLMAATSGANHIGKMKSGVTCKKGDILSYTAGGYILASNNDINKADNIVVATSDSNSSGDVDVSQAITVVTTDTSHDGQTVYLGVNGKYTFDAPTAKNTIIKQIGFFEKNKFVFNGLGYSFINK